MRGLTHCRMRPPLVGGRAGHADAIGRDVLSRSALVQVERPHAAAQQFIVHGRSNEGLGGPPRRSCSPAESSAATGSGTRHPAREQLASLHPHITPRNYSQGSAMTLA